jgi:hypothetical protein
MALHPSRLPFLCRFHELSEFDEARRSCRLRLAGHNERRRKSSADTHGHGGGGGGGGSSNGGAGGSSSSNGGAGDGCRHADQDGRGHQGNPPPNHFQIR